MYSGRALMTATHTARLICVVATGGFWVHVGHLQEQSLIGVLPAERPPPPTWDASRRSPNRIPEQA